VATERRKAVTLTSSVYIKVLLNKALERVGKKNKVLERARAWIEIWSGRFFCKNRQTGGKLILPVH
jgi:hypothetical protein